MIATFERLLVQSESRGSNERQFELAPDEAPTNWISGLRLLVTKGRLCGFAYLADRHCIINQKVTNHEKPT